MALAVCHMGDQGFRFAQFFADQLHNVNVAHFIVAAHVVHFPHPALVNDQINGTAVVS